MKTIKTVLVVAVGAVAVWVAVGLLGIVQASLAMVGS